MNIIKFKINYREILLNSRKELAPAPQIHKKKKGKGSYNRKENKRLDF
jgi:hypothetical protein